MRLEMRKYENGDLGKAQWDVVLPPGYAIVCEHGVSVTAEASKKVAAVITMCKLHTDSAVAFTVIDQHRIKGYGKSLIRETIEAIRVFCLISGAKQVLIEIDSKKERHVKWAESLGFTKATCSTNLDLYAKYIF